MRSGVDVARTTRSTSSGSIPQSASALREAAAAILDVVSPSEAKCLASIPVRDRIHSSLVSSDDSNSEFLTTRSGR